MTLMTDPGIHGIKKDFFIIFISRPARPFSDYDRALPFWEEACAICIG